MATKKHPLAWILMFLSLLSLAVEAPAQRGGGRGGGGGHRGGGGHAQSRGGGHQRSAHRQSGRSSYQASSNRGAHRGSNANRSAQARNTNRGGQHANRSANYRGNGNRSANYNRNRNVNRNVNANRNVNVNRNVHWNGNYWGGARVAAGRYYWPRGYGYVRRSVGWVVPGAFLASTYYYSGWATLGLTAPAAGYQWVRYGPDLMLVDIATGQVIDVRYGVFAG